MSRVPVLAGPEPLSAEFCGLPQPASSRTAESTSRNSLRVLMSGPLHEASQDLSGVYSLSLCWSRIFSSVKKGGQRPCGAKVCLGGAMSGISRWLGPLVNSLKKEAVLNLGSAPDKLKEAKRVYH